MESTVDPVEKRCRTELKQFAFQTESPQIRNADGREIIFPFPEGFSLWQR